jgi:hypothetical protein
MTPFDLGILLGAALTFAFALVVVVRLGRIAGSLASIHAILRSQLPPPKGFEDCSPAVLAAARDGAPLRASAIYSAERGVSAVAAATRMVDLYRSIECLPEYGRPADCAHAIDQLHRGC